MFILSYFLLIFFDSNSFFPAIISHLRQTFISFWKDFFLFVSKRRKQMNKLLLSLLVDFNNLKKNQQKTKSKQTGRYFCNFQIEHFFRWLVWICEICWILKIFFRKMFFVIIVIDWKRSVGRHIHLHKFVSGNNSYFPSLHLHLSVHKCLIYLPKNELLFNRTLLMLVVIILLLNESWFSMVIKHIKKLGDRNLWKITNYKYGYCEWWPNPKKLNLWQVGFDPKCQVE